MSSSESRAETIFFAALERASPEERARYIEEACAGDEQLRRTVERLLIAEPKVGRFLESPAVTDASAVELVLSPEAAPAVRVDPGALIGPYKLLEQIGEGGMAVVFLAEQMRPIQRKVALKVIKPGMDSRQVIARFEAERQALALMDHPNIATVLDAGTTEAGRPYFVMELVKGVPITAYCDEHRLTPAQRLELFAQVCSAVQHAHQKGIIHRDLKPSNVLVAAYDGTPVPKVIDFGIAKATAQPLTERTLFTSFGDVVGTLQYMSPEQAQLNQLDIDTRSDVYSLGVLLYELLTGTTPLEHQRVKRSALLEMLRAIREEEPPRPSTRLGTTEHLPSISANRGLEPKKLSGLIRGELDWIVMKALDKNRDRRYETVTGFATDVQRYLRDEPVAAGPPSALYRFGKFTRRNKRTMSIAGVLALAVLVGVAGLIINNRMITRERDQKEAALAGALRERARADGNLVRARRAVHDYLTSVANNPLLKEADFLELRRSLLESAIPFYEEFVAQAHEDPQLEAERGRAYGDLALVREELGDHDRALAAHEQRRGIFQRLAAQFPARLDYRHELANTHRNAGNAYYATNQHARAEPEFRRAATMLEALVSQHASAAPYRQDLAGAYNNLSILLRNLGRLDEALETQQKAAALREPLVSDFPADPQYRRDLAETLMNLSSVFSNLGRHDEALASNARSGELLKALAQQHPRSPLYREMWSVTLENRSVLLCDLGRRDEGLVALEQALRINEELTADFSSVPGYRYGLAISLMNLSILQAELNRDADGLATCERAIGILESLASESPTIAAYQQGLALTYHSQGEFYRRSNRFEESLTSSRKATTIQEKLVADHPMVPRLREELAVTHNLLGETLTQLGRYDESLGAFQKAVTIREELARTSPSQVESAVNLAATYGSIGSLHLAQQKRTDAIDWYDKALATLIRALASEPRFARAQHHAGLIYANRATALGELDRHAEALADLERALAFDEVESRLPLRLQRAATMARLQMHAEAAEEAEAVAGGLNVPAGLLRNAAAVCAACAGVVRDDAERSEQYALRAVALVRQSLEKSDPAVVAEVAKDPRFEVLHGRADFQQLCEQSHDARRTE